MFYKAINDGKIVDVFSDTNLVYVRMDGFLQMPLRTNVKADAFGILTSDMSTIYALTETEGYNTVELVEFESEEEYEAIRKALDETGGSIVEPEPDPDPEEQETIEFVREKKVSAMAAACEAAIVAGFSITDSDGVEHHYSLAVTDQIMIAQLALKAQTGSDQLPWHADGENCKFYTAAEMLAINAQMETLITYHQTYFNSLKQYINSLTDITSISAVEYGMDIPEEYRSEVLVALLGAL